jgi:hypothetical protein
MIIILNGKKMINCIIDNMGFIPLINERGPILQPRLLEINVAKVLIVKGYKLIGIDKDNNRIPLNKNMIRKIELGEDYIEKQVVKEPVKKQEPKPVVQEQPKVQKVEEPKQEVKKEVPEVPVKVEEVAEEPKQDAEVKPQQNNNNKKNKNKK